MALISVIIPVYNEEESLPFLYERLQGLAQNSEDMFEFIFVDDGSSDRSFSVLKRLTAEDSRVRLIRFSRNFGSHAACLAGLMHARGEACAFISADLQDPPELIHELAKQWKNGFDVVLGIREWEDKTPRLFQKLYYTLVKRFALKNMPEGGTDVFLIGRNVVNAVTSMKENNTSIFGLILWSGFSQTVITFKKGLRQRGVSKWTPGKKIKLFIDTFVSFSYFPVRMISVAGVVLALLGFFYAFAVIFNRMFRAVPVEGWASLMVVVLVVSGVQMIMLGIIGEYLWRNFDAARNRPSFIIKESHGFNTAGVKKE